MPCKGGGGKEHIGFTLPTFGRHGTRRNRIGQINLVVQPSVMGNGVKAGMRPVGSSNFNNFGPGSAEGQVHQPGTMRSNHAFRLMKERNLLSNRHGLQIIAAKPKRTRIPEL